METDSAQRDVSLMFRKQLCKCNGPGVMFIMSAGSAIRVWGRRAADRRTGGRTDRQIEAIGAP